MKTINELLNLAGNNCIIIGHEDITNIANGMCIYENGKYYIIIDNAIVENTKLYKEVLAEEIGHCFTMIDDPTPKLNQSFSRKCRVDKEEEKAKRWALEYLIKTNDLLNHISLNRSSTISSLSEHFVVTEEFMVNKLKLMAVKQHYYYLCDNHFLCLQNLPSIYITTFFDENIASKAKALYGRKY